MAVTVHQIENSFGEVTEYDFKGLSTDTKPTEYNGFPV